MNTPSEVQDARSAILARIRSALADVPATETPGDVAVDRSYLHVGTSSRPEVLEQLIDRLIDYRARVRRVPPADLPAAIASALSAQQVRRLAIPTDLPPDWLPADVEVLADHSLTPGDLDKVDGVLTGCSLAIAQTGTIVLDAGPTQGRRALTLVPDYHLCVVFSSQVVSLVPEAVTRLAPISQRPLTWISGPSATSDIELSRVEGVHGPRTLEVILVDCEILEHTGS